MSEGGISDWRHERQQRINGQALPWWLWPVSLLWRREQPRPEVDTVPVAVQQYVDTVPTDRALL